MSIYHKVFKNTKSRPNKSYHKVKHDSIVLKYTSLFEQITIFAVN